MSRLAMHYMKTLRVFPKEKLIASIEQIMLLFQVIWPKWWPKFAASLPLSYNLKSERMVITSPAVSGRGLRNLGFIWFHRLALISTLRYCSDIHTGFPKRGCVWLLPEVRSIAMWPPSSGAFL